MVHVETYFTLETKIKYSSIALMVLNFFFDTSVFDLKTGTETERTGSRRKS